LIPKSLRGSKSPLFLVIFWIFEVKKIRPENIAIKGHKNCIFLKNVPKPIQAGYYEDIFTQSISAKPQQRPKNRRLLPLLTNFGKKSLPLHHRSSKMVKIGRGQQTNAAVAVATTFRVLQRWKNSVIRSAMDALRNSKKKLASKL
jgi:hypothetical protein